MKRYASIAMLSVLFAGSLAACGGSTATAPAATAPAATTAAATEAAATMAPAATEAAATMAPAATEAAATTAPATGSGDGGVIKIASSLPRTGSSKGQTDTIANAIKQRLEEANNQACGGKFTLQYQDMDDAIAATGKWDAAQEASNANAAVADPDVMVYIGTFNSGAAKISIPILNAASLVMISPANTYPGLTKPGKGEPNEPDVYYPSGKRNYTRVVPADDLQGKAAANFAKSLGVAKVYILDDTELYGKGIADVFDATAKEIGIEVVAHESIDGKAADYRALAAKILDAAPDLVYYGGITQNNAGQLWKDIRNEGFEGKMMGPDGINESAFVEAAGSAADGTYATFGGLPPSSLTGKAGEWYQAYKAKFNAEPEAYAVYGYESANVALAAIEKTCTKDRAAINDAVFATKDFAGVLGTWSFDANGDTSLTSMSVSQVKGGKFEFVQAVE
ncbi:branched-chain amino acid ABC transporter substrate-binding protein [Chloroflexia bacterium SDU3-3]|nr:branched-chain amino acid ABC transporter substrate-binding protein [Chloroflexia bacterium SDU3-3]